MYWKRIAYSSSVRISVPWYTPITCLLQVPKCFKWVWFECSLIKCDLKKISLENEAWTVFVTCYFFKIISVCSPSLGATVSKKTYEHRRALLSCQPFRVIRPAVGMQIDIDTSLPRCHRCESPSLRLRVLTLYHHLLVRSSTNPGGEVMASQRRASPRADEQAQAFLFSTGV